MTELDEFDLKILAALRENGRLSNVDVAQKVGLSHSSCSRRIARMEREEVILGYRALTDREKLGLSVRAFCGVTRHGETPWDRVARDLAKIEGVMSVYAVSGDADIMTEIVARDMQHYSHVVLKEIADTPGVLSTRSFFVLSEVKAIF